MPPRTQKVRHIIPISGKDSLCTAIVQREREPNLPYEYVFNDVEAELPETYAWLDTIEKVLGIKLHRIGESLTQRILKYATLPSSMNRFCTRDAKIVPYSRYLEEGDADVIYNYIGYRYDERDRIPAGGVSRLSSLEHIKFVEKYPLIESQVSLKDVYRIIEERKLPLPNFHWPRLEEAVRKKCGPATLEYIDEMPIWEKSRLFSWRSRSNCSYCFNQRLYEWVGLLEFHPELFDEAERLEYECGNHKSDTHCERRVEVKSSSFTWHMGWPLGHIRKEAPRLFERRVNDVYNELIENRGKPRHELDLLTTTSCGAYCGK